MYSSLKFAFLLAKFSTASVEDISCSIPVTGFVLSVTALF